ncbi:hypothetical protein LR48_Vigan03g231900 [Vigna angularis]|uniref:CCHC-type domain-containing protein n=1 Tax=Phaseolus angularis TaxID=3914 RepID=A0A0L9U8C8_PHAAN|nr:hypothetical protein LR48_Vigan03g231900 [Vigna angularis]
MAPRPPPQPTEPEASDHTRLLESVIEALQQQNAALVQQNTVALQNLEAARANSEATRRQLMEIMEITRNIAGASTSSGRNRTEWSWESFLQHHPAEFNEKCLPDEVERAQVLEKNVTEVEQYKNQQQQVIRGTVSSRNNTNLRRTPYARPVLPSTSGGCQSQYLMTAGRSGQKKTVKCFKCGGSHYRSLCPQLLGGRFCTHCRRSGHLESECNMGGRAVMRPPYAGRNQARGGGRTQAIGRVYAITSAGTTSSVRSLCWHTRRMNQSGTFESIARSIKDKEKCVKNCSKGELLVE